VGVVEAAVLAAGAGAGAGVALQPPAIASRTAPND